MSKLSISLISPT